MLFRSPLSNLTQSYLKFKAKRKPDATLSVKINLNHCSRDVRIVKEWKKDKIFHDRISYQTLQELLAAGEYPLANASKVTVPNLILVPMSDKILCPNAMLLFAQRAPQKYITVNKYPDGYHTMHQDLDKEKLWSDVLNYING